MNRTHIYLALLISMSVIVEMAIAKGMGKNARLTAGGRGRGSSRYGGHRGGHAGSDRNAEGGDAESYDNAPCIGLCYHNKLQALETDDSEDYSRGWPLNRHDFDEPCVGLCYYFRSLGLENPYAPTPSEDEDVDSEDTDESAK